MFPAGDTASGEGAHQGRHHQPSDGTRARPQPEGPDPRGAGECRDLRGHRSERPRGERIALAHRVPFSVSRQVCRYATVWSATPTLAAPSTAVVTVNATRGVVPAGIRWYLLTRPVGTEGPVEAAKKCSGEVAR